MFCKSITSGLYGLGTAWGPEGSSPGDTTDWGNGTLWTVGEIIEEIVKLTLFGGEQKETCASVRTVEMP